MRSTGKILAAGLAIGGALGALTLINKLTVSQAGELNTVLTGEERRYPWKYGDIFYQVKGAREDQPLVLIHSFAPGASSYEWRKNVEALSEQFRVYAFDLLGAGLSDRPAIDYSPEIYIDLIGDFLKEVIGRPALVVAHGLSSAYAIICAYRRPQLFEKLLLVSPPVTLLATPVPDILNTAMKNVLRLPVVGESLYNLLTSHNALQRYFDRRGYHNPGLITDQLVEYTFSSAHQENSHYPAAMLYSKELVIDIHEPLARLR
ncbi:MAG: alpha/beta fold hydrolase, partial [Ktedonobacteraceae bacterium]